MYVKNVTMAHNASGLIRNPLGNKRKNAPSTASANSAAGAWGRVISGSTSLAKCSTASVASPSLAEKFLKKSKGNIDDMSASGTSNHVNSGMAMALVSGENMGSVPKKCTLAR